MTKIVCLSDSHRMHHKLSIPDGDILLFAGDVGLETPMTFTALLDFNEWLGSLPHKYKIIIGGNHDWLIHDMGKEKTQQYLSNAIYLEQSGVEIEGLKIWGEPRQPEFCDWAWNVSRGEKMKKVWAKVPENTNILLCHGPPYGILDQVYSERVGDWDLLDRIGQLNNLKLVCFGHLHFCGGQRKESHGVTFVNASVCTESYEPTNLPIEVLL